MAPLSIFLCSLLTFSSSLNGISAIDYQVTNLVPNTPSGISFTKEIGIPYAKQLMGTINEFLFSTIFQQNNPSDRKPIYSVNLYIGEYKEYLSDNRDNNINISSSVLVDYFKADMKWHFTSTLYHEMAHVFQWKGDGLDPRSGLLEGIAEYACLKANYTAPDYVKPGGGNKWNEGYGVTARFLEYCDEITPGFVAKLNAKLKSPYDVKYFNELTGKSVDQLWQDYKAKYAH